MIFGKDDGFGFIRDSVDDHDWFHTLDVVAPVVSSSSYVMRGFRQLYTMMIIAISDTGQAMKGFQRLSDYAWSSVKHRHDEVAAGKALRKDMLGDLIAVVDEHDSNNELGIADLVTEIWATCWAGSDYTSFALTTILYHLLKHKHCLAKVIKEIDTAFDNSVLACPISYLEATNLPYLSACVKEDMRTHPPIGTMLPREVPAEGAILCGRFIPAGCRVGINPAVVQFDKAIFGEDSEDFVPERWLRGDREVAAKMEKHMLHFGAGPRSCIGK
jgi:cytochrome P450